MQVEIDELDFQYPRYELSTLVSYIIQLKADVLYCTRKMRSRIHAYRTKGFAN